MNAEPKVGPELDAAVAEALGQSVVTWTTRVYVEGEWTVHVDSSPEGWSCYADHGPVVAAGWCDCKSGPPDYGELPSAERWKEQDAADIERFDHTRACLQAVKPYSTNIAAAWELLNVLDALWWPEVGRMSNGRNLGGWYCEVCRGSLRVDEIGPPLRVEAPAAPEAIARAFLKVKAADDQV